MKQQFPVEILRCINCGSHHLLQEDKLVKCSRCKHSYEIKENVPVLLPGKEQENLLHTDIHKMQGSQFRYLDHYQKDAFTSDYFAERDQGTEHHERRVREQIIQEVKIPTGTVLDVGCGKAWVAQHFCPKGYNVFSMDIALKNTSEALKRYPFKNHWAIVADAFNLPFQNESFDCIIASEIIEHVPDPALFVESLFRCLKPGGKLIVTTPYKEKLQFSLCIHCNKSTPLHAHIHSFDEKILTSLYSGAHLDKVRYKKFANRIPVHLRMHPLTRHMSFKSWSLFDKLMNRIKDVPTRIIIIWQKK